MNTRSDSILSAIIFTLINADIKDYEGNPITEINVLQGIRRLIEMANLGNQMRVAIINLLDDGDETDRAAALKLVEMAKQGKTS